MSEAGGSSSLMTPTMEMPRLAAFHRSMLTSGVRRAHLTVRSKGRDISVDFYTDSTPFELVFSYRLLPPVLLPVRRGYRIPVMLGEQYEPMKTLLGITAGTGGPWKPSEFFARFDNAIPAQYAARINECRPEHAIRYPGVNIEDADKTLYWYHRDWVQEGVTGDRLKALPTPRNLEKTRRLLGPEMADFCWRRHISICWTARKSDEQAHHVNDIAKRLGIRQTASAERLPWHRRPTR